MATANRSIPTQIIFHTAAADGALVIHTVGMCRFIQVRIQNMGMAGIGSAHIRRINLKILMFRSIVQRMMDRAMVQLILAGRIVTKSHQITVLIITRG